jgi:hypothetical protein
MAKVDLLRIVVASPGDVQPEREVVEDLAGEMNRGLADVLGVRFEVVRWETDAFPGFHPAGPQGHIDGALRIDSSDLVIGIFWKRFGTPVDDAASGTEHEIRNAYRSWERSGRPQIMVYFNQAAPGELTPDESGQWQQVKQFQRDPMFKKGLWWNYSGAPAFERLLREHLTQYLRHRAAPVEMSVKTVESPLGLMELTQVPASRSRPPEQVAPGLQYYRSPRFNFQIAWPGETWQGNDNPWMLQQYMMQMGSPPNLALGLAVTYRLPVMGFVPNVNVIVEPVGGANIRTYLGHTAMLARQFGQNEVVNEADDETQSGFRAFYSTNPFGRALYQFQRVVLAGGYAFVATASQLPPMDQVGMRFRDELSAILNSFRLQQ